MSQGKEEPISSPLFPSSHPRVAVIGAGISGVCTAAHLLKAGIETTVFDRSSTAGGVWHYDIRVAADQAYPSRAPSHGDYDVSLPGEFAYGTPPVDPADSETVPGAATSRSSVETNFSPPGPCYAGLTNNVPTSLMRSSLAPWPAGTPSRTSRQDIEAYVQAVSDAYSVTTMTHYHTRVEEIKRASHGQAWSVRTVTLDGRCATRRFVERFWEFDSVVVATGHYNMPRIPDVPGLGEWKAAFQNRVTHSKAYRSPEIFRDQNVLVIGGGVSSIDICRELDGVARQSYQSTRGGLYDVPPVLLPPSTTRIGEISGFFVDDELLESWEDPVCECNAIPGHILLKDGTRIDGIHRLIIATGYITSYPFLSHLHADSTDMSKAGPDALVTAEGSMTHNLHKDIFYIPDPTLMFVGVPYYTATFSCFDFQAQLVARVLSGAASVPNREAMRREYAQRISLRGLGRSFHSLKGPGEEIAYASDLVKMAANEHLPDGVQPMRGHDEDWVAEYWELKRKAAAIQQHDGSRNFTIATEEAKMTESY